MHNKRIFIAIAFGLFVLSGICGYFGPRLWEARQTDVLDGKFTPPDMPEDVVVEFSRSFNELLAATEPKFLPDTPILTIAGEEKTIADFGGKPTLVNLWATWCAPCVVELPSLQKLEEYYKGRMNVVALSVDTTRTPEQIADFLSKRMLSSFAGHIDKNGTFLKNLGLRGIPTSFLIGSDGQILYRFEGDADWTSESSKAFFDAFLLQNE